MHARYELNSLNCSRINRDTILTISKTEEFHNKCAHWSQCGLDILEWCNARYEEGSSAQSLLIVV